MFDPNFLINFLSILAAIGVIFVLVVVHESGHFLAARFFKMQTPVVGLGLPFFGPTFKLGKIEDIEFRFHPVLLGAYVAIPEMDDESSGDNEEAFDIQLSRPKQIFPAWQRMIVSFAGPAANLIFALVLGIFTAFTVGMPDSENASFYVAQVNAGATSTVKTALKAGDRLLGINGIASEDSLAFRKRLEQLPERDVVVNLQREYADPKLTLCHSELLKTDSAGHLGISLRNDFDYIPVKGTPVIAHLEWGWKYFSDWFAFCMNSLIYLFGAPFRHEANGPKMSDVHGIILATSFIAKILQQNILSAFQWSAVISIELAIFNLLPILPLDGGHILFQFTEIVSGGRRLIKLRNYVAQAGLTLILILAGLVIFNDLRTLLFPG
ncbi:MAG: M50 family metallopeptidase [Candidatus Caenarcaniphilales bacterium]|nr:M50 family metallopeptidase [Candidatus Caenarcaniphilales bacterium]